MKFIDEAIIEVQAGGGGNGCISFRREKYIPNGGPDGGNGGAGGSCILKASDKLSTLMDLKYKKRFKAGRGEHGMGKNMTGHNGGDQTILVPVGTVIFDHETGPEIIDMDCDGKVLVIAKGGRGGKGNSHFTSSVRQAPKFAQTGEAGERKTIRLELKLLADVGLIGFPNAGKSMLISVVSNARPKVADYPFTTKIPNLGVVRLDAETSFVVADIPGLIEGAHEGAGMGIKFLKHIERTKVLLHLIDVTDPTQTDPLKAYVILRKELEGFDLSILKKPEIIVLTKMDLPDAREREEEIARAFKKKKLKILAISAVKKEGLKELLEEVRKNLR